MTRPRPPISVGFFIQILCLNILQTMTKKNLPNIPIYIGDWERDCNVLSLETEAAWLRIIFKMWNAGKQSEYKIPAKGLQNLWKCSKEKASEIIQELLDYNICEIEIDGRFVIFTSRRFKKENELSKVRSKAASSRYDKTKDLQTSSKSKAKAKQNAENEIEIESEYEDEDVNKNENEVEIKKTKKRKNEILKTENKPDLIIPWKTESFLEQWEHWKIYKKKEFNFKFKSLQSEQASLTKLANMSNGNEQTAIAIIHQSMGNGWKGFFELKQSNQNGNRNYNQSRTDAELKRDASDAVDRLLGYK